MKTLSFNQAKAVRNADRRAAIEQRQRQLIAAIHRTCDQQAEALGEDHIQAALLIAGHERAQLEAQAEARRRSAAVAHF